MNSEGNDADIEDTEEEINKVQHNIDYSKNPEVMALLNTNVGDIAGSEMFVPCFPSPPKPILKSLKKMQWECTKIEAEFYKEVHTLECKYAQLYAPYYEKRSQVITGKLVPTEDDCDFPSDVDTDEELAEDFAKKASFENKDIGNGDKSIKGVPGFWLTVFRNVDMLADMIQDHDEPILLSLADIRVKLIEDNPMGFILEFQFEPNDYFTNDVLTKQYEMKCVVDENDPFNFDGPEICMCKGCKIDWNKNKNVTVKTIRKKQKHKQRGSVRTITKIVPNDSFFNFFNPPLPAEGDTIDEDTQILLSADFEIGHFIRERLIPRAVLFFTGEALIDLEEEEEDEDLDIEEEEDKDLDIEEEDEEPIQEEVEEKSAQKTPPPECKQQ